MKLLALETSSVACSVAVADGDNVIESHVVEPREHTRILVPMINRLLAEAGVALADLDAIVLGNGPGSFIGVRIGASVAQGLAFGAGLRIVQVSSLAAVAAEAMISCECDHVIVTQDARMSQVYAGEYTLDRDGLAALAGPERIVAADHVFETASSFTTAGQGWERYPELLEANTGNVAAISEVRLPRARFMLPSGRAAVAAGLSVDPADVVPAYLRSKVADTPRRC